ncbi:MAG: DUF3099 domain-containing protein [Micromonosporaceae bacterium]
MKRRGGGPVLITDAQRSQEEQLRIRERRYIVMMLVRAVCLIAGAVVVSTRPPLMWLWLILCAVGMTVIPYVAVVLANHRLPRQRGRRHRPALATPDAAVLPQQAAQPLELDRPPRDDG